MAKQNKKAEKFPTTTKADTETESQEHEDATFEQKRDNEDAAFD